MHVPDNVITYLSYNIAVCIMCDIIIPPKFTKKIHILFDSHVSTA